MSYFILPIHKLSIQTKKTPLEVVDCFKLQVDKYWYSDNELKLKKSKGFFVGEINGYNFSIRKAGIKRGFVPFINGSIGEHSEGSILDITVGIYYFEVIITILMILLLIIVPIGFKLGIILMLVIGLFGYKFDHQEIIDFLKRMLI